MAATTSQTDILALGERLTELEKEIRANDSPEQWQEAEKAAQVVANGLRTRTDAGVGALSFVARRWADMNARLSHGLGKDGTSKGIGLPAQPRPSWRRYPRTGSRYTNRGTTESNREHMHGPWCATSHPH